MAEISLEHLEHNAHNCDGRCVSSNRAIGVLGAGGFVPPQVRTNEEVADDLTGVTPEWIVERTGIYQRHVSSDGQSASDLAVEAVRNALDAAGLDAGDLDLIIVTTSTPDELGPSTACRVQALLQAHQAVAFDVSAACTGWLFGTRVAVDYLCAGTGARCAVVVGVEAYSHFLDSEDRATAVLFGDGAGATILGPVPAGTGFSPIELGSDGDHAGDVLIPAGGSKRPASPDTLEQGQHVIHMDGRAVRDFILEIFPKAAATALRGAGLTADQIDVIVTHQPNPVLLRTACAEAGFDVDRLVIVGDMVGNIGAGSVPYALAKASAEGQLHAGDRILIVGFGAGVTWGSTVLTWGNGDQEVER
ncbi:3-oxoacyl-ACP synthase III family protein [Nocardia sp. XZ_19_369]|uniref:3-oxoacyl-ACP synthase III family protein n=1 Tax=Nocardia sp. XZ_19_369 TaxID=2769487 RepID=UPI001890A3D2|nr:beta-ketoacyl-ACP synthase 3 [Nocardia sp. XZ_19_369]